MCTFLSPRALFAKVKVGDNTGLGFELGEPILPSALIAVTLPTRLARAIKDVDK